MHSAHRAVAGPSALVALRRSVGVSLGTPLCYLLIGVLYGVCSGDLRSPCRSAWVSLCGWVGSSWKLVRALISQAKVRAFSLTHCQYRAVPGFVRRQSVSRLSSASLARLSRHMVSVRSSCGLSTVIAALIAQRVGACSRGGFVRGCGSGVVGAMARARCPARPARRAVVVVQLAKTRGGDVGAPRLGIMKAAVAPTGPTFLVVAPRVRAEEDSAGFEGRREVAEDPGELATRHVEQRGICEDPVEAGGWQVEREEVLVQHLTIRVGARHRGELSRAVQADRGELP